RTAEYRRSPPRRAVKHGSAGGRFGEIRCYPPHPAPGPEGSSSTGRAPVSKTGGWGFESLLPCSPALTRVGASMTAPMNRQAKRMMAKQGADKPRAPERKAPGQQAQQTKERTGPRQYLREVRGELKKVAWPTRNEVIKSSVIVLIGVIVMDAIIFGFAYGTLKFVDWIFG